MFAEVSSIADGFAPRNQCRSPVTVLDSLFTAAGTALSVIASIAVVLWSSLKWPMFEHTYFDPMPSHEILYASDFTLICTVFVPSPTVSPVCAVIDSPAAGASAPLNPLYVTVTLAFAVLTGSPQFFTIDVAVDLFVPSASSAYPYLMSVTLDPTFVQLAAGLAIAERLTFVPTSTFCPFLSSVPPDILVVIDAVPGVDTVAGYSSLQSSCVRIVWSDVPAGILPPVNNDGSATPPPTRISSVVTVFAVSMSVTDISLVSLIAMCSPAVYVVALKSASDTNDVFFTPVVSPSIFHVNLSPFVPSCSVTSTLSSIPSTMNGVASIGSPITSSFLPVRLIVFALLLYLSPITVSRPFTPALSTLSAALSLNDTVVLFSTVLASIRPEPTTSLVFGVSTYSLPLPSILSALSPSLTLPFVRISPSVTFLLTASTSACALSAAAFASPAAVEAADASAFVANFSSAAATVSSSPFWSSALMLSIVACSSVSSFALSSFDISPATPSVVLASLSALTYGM